MINILLPAPKPVKFRKFGKLPGKPSELIRIAIEDLTKAEKVHKIDMGQWFNVDSKKKTCTVCLAGSVMACRLQSKKEIKNALAGKDPDGEIPQHYDYDTMQYVPDSSIEVDPTQLYDEANALEAINDLRIGALASAFSALDIDWPYDLLKENVKIISYKTNKVKFKKQMLELAAALEKQGY